MSRFRVRLQFIQEGKTYIWINHHYLKILQQQIQLLNQTSAFSGLQEQGTLTPYAFFFFPSNRNTNTGNVYKSNQCIRSYSHSHWLKRSKSVPNKTVKERKIKEMLTTMQCGPAASYPCSIMQCPKQFKSRLQFCMQMKIIIIQIPFPKR